MEHKRTYGQYYTKTNPFNNIAFYNWLEEIPENIRDTTILEPFAGANNIPAMFFNDNVITNLWHCYDIMPNEKNVCEFFPVKQQDTIKNFPKGYHICITNPPYLAKNSATRRKLAFPNTPYDDIYKLCLEIMLSNVEYVAAIIPETFITSGLFHKRLKYVVSLNCKMFEDTDCPVCLALFTPNESDDFEVYSMTSKIGLYSDLCKGRVLPLNTLKWSVNDPYGTIGIVCIDNTKEESIHFCKGSEIPSSKVKYTSRSLTRVSGLPNDIDLDLFIEKCNKVLKKYRDDTKDVFLASFKGLRKDGKYRRRLDFATAKGIMSYVLENFSSDLKKETDTYNT